MTKESGGPTAQASGVTTRSFGLTSQVSRSESSGRPAPSALMARAIIAVSDGLTPLRDSALRARASIP